MEEALHGSSGWVDMPDHEAEKVALLLPAVEQMASHEVVAMHRQARETSSEFEQPLDAYLEWSPRYNLPRARELFVAFAENPVAENRVQAAYIITFLTPYDRELGVRLWSQLLRDPDPEVREQALESLHRPLADSRGDDSYRSEWITETGITWEDVASLYTDYVEAETWGKYFHLGEVATQHVVERHQASAD